MKKRSSVPDEDAEIYTLENRVQELTERLDETIRDYEDFENNGYAIEEYASYDEIIEKLMIKDITFGTIINVPNSASLLEEVRLEIDSLNLSSKQTLILKRERSDKTFIELLLKAMKGGD